MTDIIDIDFRGIVLDEFGRIVLSDDDLTKLDRVNVVQMAGGVNDACGGTNTSCTNSNCVGSSNTGCINSSCDFSINGHNCRNQRDVDGGG